MNIWDEHNLKLKITSFKNHKKESESFVALHGDVSGGEASFSGMKWCGSLDDRTEIIPNTSDTSTEVSDGLTVHNAPEDSSAPSPSITVHHCVAHFQVISGEIEEGNVSVEIGFRKWSRDNYVLFPAAVYAGNRFRCLPKPYPPMLHEEDGIGPDMQTTITNVPRLNVGNEESKIELRSGDMSTPCFAWCNVDGNANRNAIRNPGGNGFLLLAEDVTATGYTGFTLRENAEKTAASFTLSAPAVREGMYFMNRPDYPADDVGVAMRAGDSFSIRFNIYEFACPDVHRLFEVCFDVRKDISGEPELKPLVPWSAAYRMIEEKYNESQYNETYHYYKVAPTDYVFNDWQAGWVGGGMNSLAFLADGNDLSRERSRLTMDAIFSVLQHERGYILPIFYHGQRLGDDFNHKAERPGVLLLRKDADVLLFAIRFILLSEERGEPVSPSWREGVRRLADCFVRIWERYGQFGQFVDMDTDEILIGGTASAGIAPAGLALAAKMFRDDRCLKVATEAMDHYAEHCLDRGFVNGGPGEVLQNADSESIFGLLESAVTLYEVTADAKWLALAEKCAWQCASWCVSCDFSWPEGAVFGEHGIHTAGSVYANAQNKHSAPGICTLSGASLLKLWRYTGDDRYLALLREISHNISQYVSRKGEEFMTWDNVPLHAGWMCERVNMSDWEGKKNIGGLFNGSCWCEVSCLLTYAELPGVIFFSDTGRVIALDHVKAQVTDSGDRRKLVLTNETEWDETVKVLVLRKADHSGSPEMLGEWISERCRKFSIPKHGTAEAEI